MTADPEGIVTGPQRADISHPDLVDGLAEL